MPRLTQEEEINGSQVEKDKELGHHRRTKRIETSQDTRNCMTGRTEMIIQKIECIEILPEVTEMQKIDNKQSEFSENLQHSQPVAVARGGYTQIVVNPMQLEDKAFKAWMQRLTEARKKTEKIEFSDCIETFANHTMTDTNPQRNLVKTDMESIKLNRKSNQ